jgi:hypothetical protein
VNSPFHRARLAAACTVFPGRLAASDALAVRGAVHRQGVARFRVSFPALVRDSLLASPEKARLAGHQVPRPLVGQKKTEPQPGPLAAVRKGLLACVHRAQPSAAPLVTADESEWLLEISLPAAQRGQSVLQLEEPPQEIRQEP